MNACKSLRIALAKKEMSRAQLSEALGLSITAVNRMANNPNWTCESLKKVSAVFGMKVSEFIALGED